MGIGELVDWGVVEWGLGNWGAHYFVRASDMFDESRILQECLERIEAGEPVEASLSRYPEHREEIEPLVYLALTMKRTVPDEMPAPAKARTLYRLEGALLAMKRRIRRGPWAVWALRVAAALLVVIIVGSLWATQVNSAPGKPLFPLRVAFAETRLRMHPGPRGTLELLLRIAESRVAEVKLMEKQRRVNQASIFQMVGATEDLMIALEIQPQLADEEFLEKVRKLVEEERALLDRLARHAFSKRTRHNALTLLKLSQSWEQALKQK